MENNIEEKRCALCNKPFNYKYFMFGRGCLDNMYSLLEISKTPRFIWNKELYLCTRIAWKNHKFFLSRNQKYNLTQKYIALSYLNKMECNILDDIKKQINNDINNISVFSKNVIETISFSLNDIYKLYNYWQKFNELIANLKNINWEEIDKQLAKEFIEKMSFIFDETKISNPIFYRVFYWMQYQFWQVVVLGGIFAKMNLSSKLLSHSLSKFEETPTDLIIDDKEVIINIQESEEFNQKIKELIEKYCKEGNKFSANSADNEDCKIEFNNKDLFLAIHGSPINIEIEENENKTWNIVMEIIDTYDFTDFKNFKKYVTSNQSFPMSIFSTLLNNFAVVSSKYGVIKPYQVTIKVQKNNYIVE